MALVVKDRVKESTTTTGTADFTLGGASSGFQTFAVIGNGNSTYYAIADQANGDWEVGIGTYSTTGPTLTRDTVLESSNSGSKVVFAAGTKEVFCTYPAERSVYLDTAGSAVTVLDIGTLGTSTANITTANITAGTVSTTPTSNNDIANKVYVDTIASSGITYHTPVKYEVPNTTGNLNATYNQPGGPGVGVGATLTNAGTLAAFAPDGPTASPGDRILIYNQTNQFENGVYTVTTVGNGSTAWVLTRATDADTYALKSPTGLGNGDAFFITSGNTGAGETYVCNTPGAITFGTTAITFAQISDATLYTAGTGLTLTGTEFSITNTGTAGTYGSASNVPVFVTNAQGQVTSVTNTAISISAGSVSGLAASATTDTTNAANISSGTLNSARLTGSYTGITGVGTLAAGTWNGTVIGATYGGTGQSAYAVGDLLYADTTTSLAKLADVVTGNALLSGGVGTAPAWGKIGLSTHVSGTLQVGNGGTGATTLTGYVKGNGTSAFTASASIPNADTTATSANTANTIVARDASGDFSAGTITANLNGNASTATTASNVNNGALTLAVAGTGLSGSASFTANQSGNVTFTVTSNATNANTASTIVARDASGNFSAGTITATLVGNASTATSATSAGVSTNLAGGVAGAVPYQSGAGTTGFSAAGSSGQYLQSNGTSAPSWVTPPTIGNGTLTMNTSGTGLSGTATFTANQTGASTFTVASNATSANTASTIVARDASGNFSAGTITATLSGSATSAGSVSNSVTFNNGGAGGASGSTFNGSGALTVSYNTVGAPSTTGTNASGTWGISISGNAATATSATTATTATNQSGGTVNATTGAFSGNLTGTAALFSGQGRFGGWYTSGTGNAVEVGISGSAGYVIAYDRTASAYTTLNLQGGGMLLQLSGSTANVTGGALQQGGSQVLTAGNYNSYALPLSGGTLTGTVASPGYLPAYSVTPFNWNGSIVQYYWTRIANISNVGDSQFTIEIATKTDTNYVPYVRAIASISSWNNTSQSIKLDVINSYDIPIRLALDNSGDVWLYAESVWSSYLSWTLVDRIGSPTIYTSGFTQQLTQPANSVAIAPGQTFRCNQGAATSASPNTGAAWQLSALNTLGAITQNGSQVLTAGNYNSYAPTLTGTGASGTWGINITGSAAQLGGYGSTTYIGKFGNTYYQADTWIQCNGIGGLYWPATNAAELNANTTSSYGAVAIIGSRNSWRGIHFQGGGNTPHLMFDGSANGGIYYETGGRWASYYNYSNDCWGVGTTSTSATYNVYATKGVYGGRVDAPIFYDANNTAYYVDPTASTSANFYGSVNAATYNLAGLLVNASGTASTGGSIAIQQVTAEGWTGIFCDFEPYTGWGLWHDNLNNYFSFTAEASTGSIRSFSVPSRVSGNRTAYEKFRVDQATGDTITGRDGYAQSSFRAPIFYDNNNTAYYTDPASTSNINGLTTASDITVNGLVVGRGNLSVSTNTAFGVSALASVNSPYHVAIGYQALYSYGANQNSVFPSLGGAVAIGYQALYAQTGNSLLGSASVAVGSEALRFLTTGYYNTAVGAYAARNLTTATGVVAIGTNAGVQLKSNSNCVTVGYNAGRNIDSSIGTGTGNICIGTDSGGFYAGSNNTITGHNAGYQMSSNFFTTANSLNTIYGRSALFSQTDVTNNCTFIGANSMLNWNASITNSSTLGYQADVTGSNQIQLGNSSTTTYVYGTVQNRSDGRDKADVRSTQLGLDFIEALHPVDFRWDYREDYLETVESEDGAGFELIQHPKDGSRKRTRYHHGLIAQEVKAVLDAKGIDFGGYQDHTIAGGKDVLSIGYNELIGPLIKAVQELSAQVKTLTAEVNSLRS